MKPHVAKEVASVSCGSRLNEEKPKAAPTAP